MKRFGWRFVLGGALVLACALGALQLLWTVDYGFLESVTAPNGKNTAWVYFVDSGEPPPYHTAVGIAPDNSKPHYFAKPTFVFRGMCARSRVYWRNSINLVIECEKREALTVLHMPGFDGIVIAVELVSRDG